MSNSSNETNAASNDSSNNNSSNISSSNSLNTTSLLSLAGFMGATNMRGSNMANMPGLNHIRPNMPVINQNIISGQHNMDSSISTSSGNMWMTGNSVNSPSSYGNSSSTLQSQGSSGGISFPVWGEMADSLLERGRSKNWTYEETMELINTYTSDEWQSKFSSEKKNHRAIWSEMAEVLKKREGVTGDEARQRLNNLKALYNRIRRQLISGEISAPQWEYWESLHSFLSRPSQYPISGFARESSPMRCGLSPPNHPLSSSPYPPMQHLMHRPSMLHSRMPPPPPHMMHSPSNPLHMTARQHGMPSTMHHFPHFKVRINVFKNYSEF